MIAEKTTRQVLSLHHATTTALHGLFCGAAVVPDALNDEGLPEACARTLFIAHPEGCEYLAPVLETALADRGYTLADGTLTADTDAGDEEDKDDPFALLTGVPFPDQVVVIRSAGIPQGLEIWVGFAPVFD